MTNEEMKGVLFHNDKKTSEKSPDYKGSALIGGKVYYISLWKRTGKMSGKEFFSLAFTAKDRVEHKSVVNEVAKAVGGNEILDEKPLGEEEIPF